jgi:hypothetical protein
MKPPKRKRTIDTVMAGFVVPGIHSFNTCSTKDVDAQTSPGMTKTLILTAR